MQLLNKLTINKKQGYAFYYEDERITIERYNGFEDISTNKKITMMSNFRLASVSKQFIAYSILILIKEKKLAINDILYDMFNNMPEYTKNIKIMNLLNHTSGLYDYDADKDNIKFASEQIQDEEVLDFIRATEGTYFEVGSKYQYSNTAYVILGLIIKEKSKMTIGEFIKENIFNKLNMVNSCVNYEGQTIINNRAYGHIIDNGELTVKDQYWCSATIGDGGLYSSVNDLINWLNFLYKNVNDLGENMFKPNIIDGVNTEYGFGIRIKEFDGRKVIYHCGETIGTNTIIGFIPNENIRFIFLTNLNGINTSVLIDNLLEVLK